MGLRAPLWAFLSAACGSVDVHRQTRDGATALQVALAGGHADAATLLQQLMVRRQRWHEPGLKTVSCSTAQSQSLTMQASHYGGLNWASMASGAEHLPAW